MSTARKYSLPELKQMMRNNGIIEVTLMNKPEMLQRLHNLGLMPDEALIVKKEKKTTVTKVKDKVDYNRNKPKKVLVTDVETGLETVYPAIYQFSRALGCSTTQIFLKNGQVLNKRYKIDIVGSQPVGDDSVVPVIKSERAVE